MMWILLGLLLISLLAITLFLIFYNKQGCYTCSEPKSVQSCPCAACPCPECPEPPPCPCAPCPCPACPTCPDCGSSQPQPQPAGDTTPIVPLDHSTTDTNLENCGSTVLLPVFDGGLTPITTSCFKPNKEMVIDTTAGSVCVANNRPIVLNYGAIDMGGPSPALSTSALIAIYPDRIENWTGTGTYPTNLAATLPQNPPLDFNAAVMQITYKMITNSLMEVYFNGKKVATFNSPSMDTSWVSFASCDGPSYCKFQPIS